MGPIATTSDRRAVGLLARLQGGCVATWQLRWLGLAETTISRIVHSEGWTTVHVGVLRLPGIPDSPLSQLWAAVLALSPRDARARADDLVASGMDPLDAAFNVARSGAFVTGLSGAWVRRLVNRPPRTPHLLVRSEHHSRRKGIEITRGTVDWEMWSWVDGLPVANGPRLFWDIAWTRRHRPAAVDLLVDAATTADRLRVMAVDELLAVVEEPVLFGLPRRAPRLLVQVAEELRPGFSHSKTEALARVIATERTAALGLVAEPRPYAIRSAGRIIAEADIAVVHVRFDAEVDGPHHLLRSQQRRDRRRDGRLAPVDWAVGRYPTGLIDESPGAFGSRFLIDLQAAIDRHG